MICLLPLGAKRGVEPRYARLFAKYGLLLYGSRGFGSKLRWAVSFGG